jgi:dolichol-phosphate mannosyltransferase
MSYNRTVSDITGEGMKGLIIVPTYNEKDNIEAISSAVLELPFDFNVLIVDDNSPDGTGDIADKLAESNERIFVLHNPEKKGIGPAYICGFKWGIEKGYDILFEMDADFSHRPHYLHDFMKAIEDADLVLGSRYISGVNVVNWPLRRLLLSYFANVYTRIVTGLPIQDATGGFKCFRREVLESIDLTKIHSSGYTFQIEMTMRAHTKGFRIKEVPIIFYDRTKGTSKMSFQIAREAVYMVWKLRLLKLLGRL